MFEHERKCGVNVTSKACAPFPNTQVGPGGQLPPYHSSGGGAVGGGGIGGRGVAPGAGGGGGGGVLRFGGDSDDLDR
jgi:hypothetical protein